jgi:hypothetical protein
LTFVAEGRSDDSQNTTATALLAWASPRSENDAHTSPAVPLNGLAGSGGVVDVVVVGVVDVVVVGVVVDVVVVGVVVDVVVDVVVVDVVVGSGGVVDVVVVGVVDGAVTRSTTGV